MSDTLTADDTWECWWWPASIVSMLRQHPGSWITIGSGSLAPEPLRHLSQEICDAGREFDVVEFELRCTPHANSRATVEARLTR